MANVVAGFNRYKTELLGRAILHFQGCSTTLDPHLIVLSVMQGVIKYCFGRCPWCSRYRRRKWTRRHEFKSWTRLIAFHIALIPLGKV